MIEIKDLLLKFSNILNTEGAKKESIREILNEVLGINLELKDIKIKNNIIYLDIKPIYKNEIFMKKDLINLKLKNTLGKKAPTDIK